MHLASDYIHPLPGKGRCRVRIFEPHDEADALVIVLTELRENLGQSVTNAAERLTAEVLAMNRIEPPVVVVEHYEDGARGTPEDPHTFDLVTFETCKIRWDVTWMAGPAYSVSGPAWKALDRASVEALVGRRID